MADLTLRLEKGTELTFAEIDGNFLNLDSDITLVRNNLDSLSGTIESRDSALINSIVEDLVDSAYVNSLADFYNTARHDSDTLALVDSAYVQARQVDIYRDSAFITGLIDSAHVRLHVKTDQDLGTEDDVEFQHIHMSHASGALSFSVVNNSGSQLSRGTVVYISGVSGTIPEISPASCTSSSTMPAFGVLHETIADGDSGHCITFGSSSHIDTSAFNAGDTLYVGTFPGTLTNVVPSGTNLIQNIGKVQRVHANNGIVKVGGAGRTNATPNLQAGQVFYGSDSNYSVPTLLTSIVDSAYLGNYVNTSFLAEFNIKELETTDSLNEGAANLYYTESRVEGVFDTQFQLRTTDSLSEGSTNLYYTEARIDAYVDSSFISNIVNDNFFTDNSINISAPQLELGSWKIQEVGGELVFYKNNVKKAKIKSSGEIVSISDVTAFGTV